MSPTTRLALLTFMLYGCGDGISVEPPELETDCDDVAVIAISVTSSSAASDESSLLLSGTVTGTSGFAVREFSISGIAASNERSNYSSWSIQLPEASYRLFVDGSVVRLDARVATACVDTDVEIEAPLPEALMDDDTGGAGANGE